MKVVVRAKALALYSIKKTDNGQTFPKKYRFSLVNRIQDAALDITDALLDANDLSLADEVERPMRFRSQRTALRTCRKLIFLIELSHDLELIDDKAFAYWATQVSDVKNMTAAWYKSDTRRAGIKKQ